MMTSSAQTTLKPEKPVTQSNSAQQRQGGLKAVLISFWRQFRSNRGALIGLWFMVGVMLLALLADVVAPHSPVEQFLDSLLMPPVWQEGGSWEFILGTDAVGRDQLSRLIHGARYSFYIGFIVIGISLSVGILLGLAAAFSGSFVENIIMRVMDIVLAFPSLLLALVLVAILGPGLTNAMIAIAITYLPHFVRITRAQAMSELSKDYVMASRTLGAGPFRLMFINVLPNCFAPLIVQATLSFSTAILDAAALGFLGMGAQPPASEWGTMLADSREFMLSAWWLLTMPGLMILLTVLSINLMGDGLRDALDPKMKRAA